MASIFDTLRTRLEKRAEYRRTVSELRRMPLDVAIDLDMDPAEARRVARRAVYGA